MNFKMLKEGQKWDDLYQLISLPKDIIKYADSQKFDEEKENIIPKMSSIYHPNLTKKSEDTPLPHYRISSLTQEKSYSGRIKDDIIVVRPPKKQQIENKISEKDPYLKLSHGLGFSGKYCPDIRWMKSLDSMKELIYASGSLIVVNNVEHNTHRFFYGHNEPIVCLDIYKDNEYLVSAQDGNKCLIKLWTPKDGICISTIQPPYESIKSVSFSYEKKLLCSVGTDHMKRQIIIIWDLENIIHRQKVI